MGPAPLARPYRSDFTSPFRGLCVFQIYLPLAKQFLATLGIGFCSKRSNMSLFLSGKRLPENRIAKQEMLSGKIKVFQGIFECAEKF